MTLVVRGARFGHCSSGTRADEGLNKPAAPESRALGPAFGWKRLFLVSECVIYLLRGT